MNRAIKKCCICNNKETGEFIMIDDNKYHTSCIEKLQQEKQEIIDYIKEQIHYIKTNFSQTRGHHFMLNDRLEVYEEILSKIEKR